MATSLFTKKALGPETGEPGVTPPPAHQPATFAKNHRYGGLCWRYAIPGHGVMSWIEAFRILAAGGYRGAVSIELEDENFNGTEAGEKLGLTLGCRYLEGC